MDAKEFDLLTQRSILDILDGDTILFEEGGRQFKMPYLSGPKLVDLSKRDPDRTTLTLPLKEESDNYRQIESSDSFEGKMDMRVGRTAQNKQAIVEYLTTSGPSKSSDIAAAVGLKVTRTNQILREMIAAGTIKAEGQARNREYRLSE